MPERSKLMSAKESTNITRNEIKGINRERVKGNRPVGKPNYLAGGHRSRAVLKDVGYDPIRELVNRYRIIERDADFWRSIRDGTIVPVTENGVKKYNALAHSTSEAMLVTIGEKLLRYGYGRVPEVDNSERRPTPLIIDLGARDGTLTIGRDPVTYEEEDV